MSGERESTPAHDPSIISTKLRACEACKSRKIRCDKLSPCSSCRSANIQCWTSRRPQEKRERVLISNKYEQHLENINAQLSQLQATLANLARDNPPSISQQSTPHAVKSHSQVPSAISPSSIHSQEASSSTIPYLGESSFEVHSQQTSQVLEKALSNTPPSNFNHDDTSSALQSLRDLLKEKTNNSPKSFTHDLPMIPMQTVLRALRLIDMFSADSPHRFLHYTPMIDEAKLKEVCQAVYFPINGYSMSDLILVNGGLMSILRNADATELKACNIDSDDAAQGITICESNLDSLIERIDPFLEPTVTNIDALLACVQILLGQSKLQKAWTLVSMASRLCLDSGLNRLQDDPKSSEDPEVRAKKISFWFAYSLDKALSLNFGRTSNFSDFDITVTYPAFPDDPEYDIYTVWMDHGKIQSRIYEKLYSAQGQLQSPGVKAQEARVLARELLDLRDQCRDAFSKIKDQRNIPFLDTEVTILSNLTLVYRALPTRQPDHPLRFPEECIAIAREALQLHQRLCLIFFERSDNSIRMYIDWNLAFCPFTPFIVILGTAILNTDYEDMNLLTHVVESLETASQRAPGATKLYNICKILLKGAKSCIEQSLNNPPANYPRAVLPTMRQDRNAMEYGQDTAIQGGEPLFSDNWDPLQLDHLENMSTLFDNYLVGNASMMPILEADLTQFDIMESSNNGY